MTTKITRPKNLIRLTEVLRAVCLICAAGVLSAGCQAEKNQLPQKTNPELTVKISPDTAVQIIDPNTADRLKRNSINYVSSEEDEKKITSPTEAQTPNNSPDNTRGETKGTNEIISTGSGSPVDSLSTGQSPDESNHLTGKPVELSAPDAHVPTSGEENKNPATLKLADPNLADKPVTIDFENVDIRVVLDTIGQITGINFMVDERVKGTVTVLSPTQIRMGDLYEFLESILAVNGYAAIPGGNFVKIVPRSEAAKQNLRVRIGKEPADIPQDDSFITQIIHLRYADAGEVSNILKPLLESGAQMATYTRTNTILITDTGAHIHHLAKIIHQLDVQGAKEEVRVIGLVHASAAALSRQITEIMAKGQNDFTDSRHGSAGTQLTTNLKIIPDNRTNSLIVISNLSNVNTVAEIARQLDVEQPRGATIAHVKPLKHAQAEELAKSLSAVLVNMQQNNNNRDGTAETPQNVQVTFDTGTNSLIITASAQDYKVIENIIDELDIPREQVLVELRIMEISEDLLREIGIDWSTLDQAVSDHIRGFGETNFGVKLNYLQGNLEGLGVGAWKNIGGQAELGAILQALEKISGVNILSTPHILTSNHHNATIFVGENIPYVEQSRITETEPSQPTVIQTYKYKDVGVRLDITPHISQGGMVRLEIDSEFTKLIESVTGLGSETPTTAMRTAKTAVTMKSGATVVIGGLIRDDKVTLDKKIPLLADIPLIGDLFRWKRYRMQKTNLLLFLTPYILSKQEDLARISDIKRQEMEAHKNTTAKLNAY